MKNTTKMMVVSVVLLLAAAMLVMPAAAARGDTNVINDGDTVFVYEEGLDFTNVFNFANYGDKLKYYSGDIEGHSADNTLTLGTGNVTSLLSSKIGGDYGTYYACYQNNSPNTAMSVQIKKPKIDDFDIQLFLSGDSLDEKTVTRSTDLKFVIESNIGDAFNADAKYDSANKGYVQITTPVGGKLKIINDADFINVYLDEAKKVTTGGAAHFNFEGMDAGTYTAQFKFGSYSDFYDNGVNSELVTFTVKSQDLTIESGKDSVVRNNPFVVTISGESKKLYTLYIKEASTPLNEMPYLPAGQSGVTAFTGTEYSDASGVICNVTMKADGTRPVQFDTNESTNDKTYTLKVVDPAEPDNTYDTVKVKVEKGDVTVTAAGDMTYYIGIEVVLSGTNTDSDYVYLFVTGPNLDDDGSQLTNVQEATVTCDEKDWATNGFDREEVKTDDTWEYKWQTDSSLDAGTYTVYAVSTTVNKNDLSDSEYGQVAVTLKKPFVTATASSKYVAKGDKLHVTGMAEGDPDTGVQIWVFGRNYVGPANGRPTSESVEDDGSFDYELDNTDDLSTGQYFVVVQHPMENNKFDVEVFNCDNKGVKDAGNELGVFNTRAVGAQFFLTGENKLQGSEAAQALITELGKSNIDDTYQKLQFFIAEAKIEIDPIGEKHVGATFDITGTTNLAVDDELIVNVESSAFKPSDKTQASGSYGTTGTVVVTAGEGEDNVWSFNVDASTFKPDRYSVKVESIDADVTQTREFDVLAAEVTTKPTEPVDTPTTEPATEKPTTPPATVPTTAAPGFGALIALIGLGAVAALVIRKD